MTMERYEAKFWGPRWRDVPGLVRRLATEFGIALDLVGMERGWFMVKVTFIIEGEHDAMQAFKRRALDELT